MLQSPPAARTAVPAANRTPELSPRTRRARLSQRQQNTEPSLPRTRASGRSGLTSNAGDQPRQRWYNPSGSSVHGGCYPDGSELKEYHRGSTWIA